MHDFLYGKRIAYCLRFFKTCQVEMVEVFSRSTAVQTVGKGVPEGLSLGIEADLYHNVVHPEQVGVSDGPKEGAGALLYGQGWVNGDAPQVREGGGVKGNYIGLRLLALHSITIPFCDTYSFQ